jgi:Zn-dependent protease
MALFWALVLKLAIGSPAMMYSEALKEMARVGIGINGVLMVLNLLPLPPLDGGRIAVSLLPPRAAWKFSQLERWGFPILLALLFLGWLDYILRPLLRVFNTLIRTLFGF